MSYSLVVSCEHASVSVPPEVGDLGVPQHVLRSHVGWDPGAREVAEAIARVRRVPLFLGRYTRLVVDLNRSPTSPEVVPENAFGTPVPANALLSAAGRRERIDRYHRPYWSGAFATFGEMLIQRPNDPLLHLSIHSFTGTLHGETRPMAAGVLYDPGRHLEVELAAKFCAALEERGVETAHNGPYDGRADALTTACRRIFLPERYAGIEIEINQSQLERSETIIAGLIDVLERI